MKHAKVAVPVGKYAKWIGKTVQHVEGLMNKGQVDSVYRGDKWMVYIASHRVEHYRERCK